MSVYPWAGLLETTTHLKCRGLNLGEPSRVPQVPLSELVRERSTPQWREGRLPCP